MKIKTIRNATCLIKGNNKEFEIKSKVIRRGF